MFLSTIKNIYMNIYIFLFGTQILYICPITLTNMFFCTVLAVIFLLLLFTCFHIVNKDVYFIFCMIKFLCLCLTQQ